MNEQSIRLAGRREADQLGNDDDDPFWVCVAFVQIVQFGMTQIGSKRDIERAEHEHALVHSRLVVRMSDERFRLADSFGDSARDMARSMLSVTTYADDLEARQSLHGWPGRYQTMPAFRGDLGPAIPVIESAA